MEERLAGRVKSSDAAAFAQLVERHQMSVYNLCYRVLGDATEAAQVAQQVFVRAFDEFRNDTPERACELWLLALASQRCIDLLGDSRVSRHNLNGRSPADEMQSLLTRLEPTLRCVVVLHYAHDLACEEIAEVTGDTVGDVRSQLHRARRALAQAVVSQEDGTLRQRPLPTPRPV